jgi:uncharacterized protein
MMTKRFDRILRFFNLSPSYHFIVLSDIEIDWLKERRIKGLILDLDNTIVSEDDRYLSPQVEVWLHQVKESGIQIFLVSNGKRQARFLAWKEHLNLSGIYNARKPFKSGFQKALRSMNLRPNEVIVIGDSFHTDVLGSKISKLKSIQVSSLPHPKRWWEKLIGTYVQKSYPHHYSLDINENKTINECVKSD